MSDRSSDWLVLKYDVLSALVPFTNRVRWSSDRAHDTMHAALWNGSAYDVQVTNRLLWNRTRHLAAERVLDAGCGWGGTVFFLAEARRRAAQSDAGAAVTATYDGLTLSTTQAATAARTATAKGLAGSCRFVVASYEAPLEQAAYDLIVAIESLEHASDLTRSLANFGQALRPGGTLFVVSEPAA